MWRRQSERAFGSGAQERQHVLPDALLQPFDPEHAALAELPALRALSVSCLNVDDEGLSALPRFPALRELMPMDVPDEGYRHIAGVTTLESLVLMYCRDTTDRATEHIGGLPHLHRYFASYTRITDRTPEILGGVESLEEVTLHTCAGLTNRGIAALARLPRLRRLEASGMPHVTRRWRRRSVRACGWASGRDGARIAGRGGGASLEVETGTGQRRSTGKTYDTAAPGPTGMSSATHSAVRIAPPM